jgi:hypothetical protein
MLIEKLSDIEKKQIEYMEIVKIIRESVEKADRHDSSL